MIEMSVAGLALDISNRTPIILLRDPSGRRQVPIGIDHAQAHNIMAGIQPSTPHRPLSHDLMMSLLEAGKLNLDRIIIHSIEKNSFQAVLKLRLIAPEKGTSSNNSSSILDIDARPSDAIALAVRSKCSIWMFENVVAEASIPVDADADAQDQVEFKRFIDQVSPAALIRHLKNRRSKNEGTIDFPDSKAEPEE